MPVVTRLSLIFAGAVLVFAPLTAHAQSAASPVPAPAAAAVEEENAADNINVKLQVPLPFIEMRGEGGTVKNLTDYLQGAYRLIIGAGAIFAVVMMIIAGYQLIFSGGSSDKTGAAKKRIFNAGIGLILALISFVSLNAITPRLVQLRLPQVAPVPAFPEGADETSCTSSYLQSYALTQATGQNLLPEDVSGSNLPGQLWVYPKGGNKVDSVSAMESRCGTEYSMVHEKNPDNVLLDCQGTVCADDQGNILSNQTCYEGKCEDSYLVGSIQWPRLQSRYVDRISLYAICTGRGPLMVQTQSLGPALYGGVKAQSYRFSKNDRYNSSVGMLPGEVAYDFASRICGVGLRGFILKVQVNDDSGLGPSIDDEYAIGPNGGCSEGNPGSASQPLVSGKRTTSGTWSQGPVYDFDELEFNPGAGDAYALKLDDGTPLVNWGAVKQHLFHVGDHFSGSSPAVCNIKITDEHMPTL